MTIKTILAVIAAGGLLAVATAGGAQPAQRMDIKVLSSPRPDLVSGGDALVEAIEKTAAFLAPTS